MNKIPEGTQYIESGCGEKGFRKYEKGCWWFFEGYWRHVDWKMRDLIPVSEHPFYAPQPDIWNGEGLPPAGTDCEAKVKGGNGHWKACKVFARTADYLIVTDGKEETPIRHQYWEFRAIRTAEQIAEDQKKQEVQELMIILGSVESAAYKDIATAIQQANFRKQVPQ